MAHLSDSPFPFELLKECFRPDFGEGRVYHLTRPLSHFVTEAGCKTFNSTHPGNEALATRGSSGCHGKVRLYGEVFHLSRTRVLLAMKNGRWPVGLVGHRNLDCYDDRIDNLREQTQSEQSAFARFKPGKTGVRGVKLTPAGKYHANINHLGEDRFLGSFDTIEEAQSVHDAAAMELHGEFARIAGPNTGAAS